MYVEKMSSNIFQQITRGEINTVNLLRADPISYGHSGQRRISTLNVVYRIRSIHVRIIDGRGQRTVI